MPIGKIPAALRRYLRRPSNPWWADAVFPPIFGFGNYKGRAVGLRRYAPLFPAFFDLPVQEMHLEMASREFAEIEIIHEIAGRGIDVAVGIIDVKSYYIETPADVAERVRLCLKHAPAERLSFAPDCGLSQTARWAARQKLANLVSGVAMVRRELGLS
jgi:5-methyltetrahydropteroyltriglutamate--homocysteine methyltransferase